jgi:uncharacterized surface protein with fasciclin (FAS1) repeats
MRNRITIGLAAVVAAATVAVGAPPAQAQGAPATQAQGAPAEQRAGTTSLATVLAADGIELDNNWKDFDIVEAAVGAVLAAKPDSPVRLLTEGRQRLTAFVPSDLAFRRLVRSLTGSQPGTEAATFEAADTLGIDTIESVLLYHVVAGRTLTSPKVLAARGSRVATATGATLRVTIRHGRVFLGDLDRDADNAEVRVVDINRGNRQVAHGVNRVLRPFDL